MLGSRRLFAPRGDSTRPTADRVREALFNILGSPPDSARVLDLFAGSGALALEALSRGAQEAVLVDSSEVALRALRRNADALDLTGKVRILHSDALRAASQLRRSGERFTWIFLDPPYQSGLLERALKRAAPLLGPDGIIAAEYDIKHPAPTSVPGLEQTDTRRYGDTALAFYRAVQGELHGR